jgi:hypothetical protein
VLETYPLFPKSLTSNHSLLRGSIHRDRLQIRDVRVNYYVTEGSRPSAVMSGQQQNDPATSGGGRIIDENTDMSTLTDQEIMKLMEGMDHQDVQLDKVGLMRSV